MKVNLKALKHLYEHLKQEEELERVFEDSNVTFEDFEQYIINVIRDNIEYDFGVDFEDYVDMNNFVIVNSSML